MQFILSIHKGPQPGRRAEERLGLIFSVLFPAYTISVCCCGGSRKPTSNQRNADRISLSAPPSLLRLTDFLDNLVRLIFPVRVRACTIICLLWW